MDLRKSTPVNGGIYGLALAGTMAGEALGVQSLVYACKPLLMIVLSSWFYFNSRRVGDRFTLLVQGGLFFSLVGDVALMFQHVDQFNFLIGLGAFLLAQLCYTFAFSINIAEADAGPGTLWGMLMASVVLVIGFVFGLVLMPRLDAAVSTPVLIYVAAITLMAITAALRFGRTYLRSFVLVFGGALLFMASDGLLAAGRFLRVLEDGGWAVMLTYGAAQFLIAAGALAHVLDPEELRRRSALST
jgi:uncharacterized membrane protein YhhN